MTESFKGARLAFSCPRPVRDVNEQTILAPVLPNLTFAFTTCGAETFSLERAGIHVSIPLLCAVQLQGEFVAEEFSWETSAQPHKACCGGI